MICPHCSRTIAEQDRYLMSVDRDAQPPAWAKHGAALTFLFLAVFTVLVLAHA